MGRSTADMFCKHIHYLAEKSVDLGCDPGRYCPPDRLTRLPMASFVAKALVQPGGDAAVPLLTDRVLLNRRRHPRPDGEVPRQRVQVDAVRTVARQEIEGEVP